MTAKVFDSDGTTPLLTGVQPDVAPALFTSGGIAFHATGSSDVYWDTITDPPAANSHFVTQALTIIGQLATGGNRQIQETGANSGGANLDAGIGQFLELPAPASYRAVDTFFSSPRQAEREIVAQALAINAKQDGFSHDSESGGMGQAADSEDTEDLALWLLMDGKRS
jgi:hypothetical protein